MDAGDPVALEAQEDVAALYVWGFPLLAMHRTRTAHGRDPAAGLVGRRQLSTAADRSVVGPNNDTLYASAWFDLRDGDVTIDVDPMDHPDRYWSVMLLDAYTNVSYVCRRLHGVHGTSVRVTLDPAARPSPDASPAVVPVATPTVWVLGRVLVDGPEDLDAAVAVQDGVRASQPAAVAVAAVPPAPAPVNPKPSAAFVDELRAALGIDPPASWHPPMPPGGQRLLDDPPPEDVLQAGAERGDAQLRSDGQGEVATGNGWGTRVRGADFGDDVAYRANFARVSLAGHLPAENRSYLAMMAGEEPAQLRFPPGGEPPVGAFWSLTVYGPDFFFVPNPIDRFSIGDRTAGLRRDDDGGLTIHLGAEPPAAEAARANWLPTPPGRCTLALRAYEGKPEVVAATWFPPPVTQRRVSQAGGS